MKQKAKSIRSVYRMTASFEYKWVIWIKFSSARFAGPTIYGPSSCSDLKLWMWEQLDIHWFQQTTYSILLVLIHPCSYFVDLSLPPRSLLIQKKVTSSKTRRRYRHANLVSTMDVTVWNPPPPPPPLKNPSFAPCLLPISGPFLCWLPG